HSLQQVLELRGHEVEVAYNGHSALERLLTFEPEIGLCDIGLPDLDGFAFAKRVRTELGSSAVLVALSGYARAEDIVRAKAAGFDHHIAKPASLEEIEAVLATARLHPQ